MTSPRLLVAFPAPPREVQYALDSLTASANWTEAQRASMDPRSLDRPWDPSGCQPGLRAALWPWLDQVAAWVNHEYAWQSARVIPACWPRHPHLVHELAVLACLRAAACDATGPHALEEWHRYALPGFSERIADRIGPVACPPGRHTDWPASSRYLEFTAAADHRNQLFEADAPFDHAEAAPPPPPTPGPPPRRPHPGGQRSALRAVPDPELTEGDQA